MRFVMKLSLVLLALLVVQGAWAQNSVVWQKTAATSSLPSWFSTGNFERGLAFGSKGAEQRLYVVSRNVGNHVYVLNAATGDSLGQLNVTGLSGGAIIINDVETSEDGIVFASNVTSNATTSPLKIYWWTSDTGAPSFMSYTGTVATQRFGDVFTVTGSVSNSTAKVYALAANPPTLVTFTTADSGKTWTPAATAITGVPGTGQLGSVPSVAPIGDASTGFWINGNSVQPLKIDAAGAVVDSIPGTIAPKTSSSLRYFEKGSAKYLAVYWFVGATPAGGYVTIFDVTNGGVNATLYATFPIGSQFGTNANVNGAGDVSIKNNGDGTFDIAGLGSNNGLGVYRTNLKVNVTFHANTATMRDTVSANSQVSIAGGDAALGDWGTSATMTNIGGDYWSKTVQLDPHKSYSYKYRWNGGWENDLGSGNRVAAVGGKDTTLRVEFYNNTGATQAQYWRPWVENDTMVTIYFRVNMLGLQSRPFNRDTDTVGVRGDKQGGSWGDSNFGWAPTRYLTREANDGMGLHFWSTAIQLSKSKVQAGETGEYKYLIGYDWGRDESGNRSFKIPYGNDTTLAWVWYNNEAPIIRENNDTVTVTFVANMTTATQRQSFALGDTVEVEVGQFSTADSTRSVQLIKQGGTQNYAAQITMRSKIGAFLDYQYYLVKNGARVREYYYNFQYSGTTSGEAERRQVTLTGNTQTVLDNVVSVTDARRQPYFENQQKLSQAVTVTWEVDLRPAYYTVKAGKALNDIQGTLNVTIADSITAWGVAMNGPAALAPSDWGTWGRGLMSDTNHAMFDNGTNGDAVAGDSIWSFKKTYPVTETKGQVFKFGIGGGDNESGYGLNHLENIDDSNPTYTLSTQFGSINPNFYDAWDYTNRRPVVTVSVDDVNAIPAEFSLSQNYPNPFNPATSISFALPVESQVSLKIFNVLGQEVATVVDGVMKAGRHTVSFNASKLASGVYLYQMKTGSFTSLKKMLLTK